MTATEGLDAWAADQLAQLEYFKHAWPLRECRRAEISACRLADAAWLLEGCGMPAFEGRACPGFTGRVLEVGSGPVGFFDLVEGITCDAIDPLMAAYAWELPFAGLGPVGATAYWDRPIAAMRGPYDWVVCSNVLPHAADWRTLVTELGVATGTGRLLLATPVGLPRPAGGAPCSAGEVLDAVRAAGLPRIEHLRCEPLPWGGAALFMRAAA